MNSIFVLHARAAQILLQQRDFLHRLAAKKPVIHAIRSENNRLKDQVAGKAPLQNERSNVRLHMF